ncbi:MAG: molybdopterin molybdotransferase MoeA, partial [Bauldia sp.]|nr:molybdopterin molybdotransferase MoeA [Bauldia sp.]
RVMGMRESALAAAMGHAGVPVRRRPRIAIIATGDELVPPSAVPGPDQIVGSNAFGLAAFARSVGAEPFDLGIVPDRLAAIGEAVERATALSADILVTLGGASVGDHDLVRQALSAKGMTLDFWRVAMRPGKPLMFGRLGAMRVVGLPGNPVSSLVCSLLFLKPLVAALLGQPEADPSLPAAAGADLPANDSVRQDYVRAVATIDDHGIARAIPMETQDSSALAALGTADCLLVRPPHAPPARAGDPCRIIRLP